jgi:NAD(P)H-hydrate epimerase
MAMQGTIGLTRAYTVEQAREIDRLASASFEIPSHELMERAGRAAFRLVCERWPLAQQIIVACGAGNNGGDGYVLARLLLEARREVHLLTPGGVLPSTGDALRMYEAFCLAGGRVAAYVDPLPAANLIVDALLGIGLKRPPEGAFRELIEALNAHGAPILALDVPSGLDADTGAAPGAAIRADCTLSFIVCKQGLLTGRAPALVGTLLVDDLGLPAVLLACVPPAAEVIDGGRLPEWLPARARDAHKGDHGHVLVVGGEEGYGGAVRLAAEAAARVGAGLVSVATRALHVAPILAARPELMVRAVAGPGDLDVLLEKAKVVVIGPGLGRSTWSEVLLAHVTESGKPTVIDADALNWLADSACVLPEQVVLTPHPGEAARLLEIPTPQVQANRFAAVRRLAEAFGATAVLKGAGTLVADARGLAICPVATPALATGGTGDVLAGAIGGLIAQGLAPGIAARAAVVLHALAGLAVAADGERGALAGDLLLPLRKLANPGRA